MQNGYFRLVNDDGGFGIALYQPRDGGEYIKMGELFDYLDGLAIPYDRKRMEMRLMDEMDSVCHLGGGSCPVCPETYHLTVDEDGMAAFVRFIPPSEAGKRMTMGDFLRDLKLREITFGLKIENLQGHFSSPGVYCTDIMVAEGQKPVNGTDAKLEYCFNTDNTRRPAHREDGSVDFFHMTTINQCKKGEVLARIIPEKPGIPGHDIYNQEMKPREARKQYFKYGRNIELSEDKLRITSMVDGHVSLVDDKVFVNDVYQVKAVDVATGNLEYEGSIQVDGNVTENFEVKAGGNVFVNGLVEGSKIVAGGSIIISKGMNGMGKGFLKAGGDVVVKFLENTRVEAGGYVETEAIMHSRISSGSDVTVVGRRGLIVGGYVQAGTKIIARNIGAGLGAATILEVGVNPQLRTQYSRMEEALGELARKVKDARVILDNFHEKLSQGVQYNEGQLKYMRSIEKMVQEKGAELVQMNQRVERFRAMMDIQKYAVLEVDNEIHPGTTIIIGDASRTIQSSYHYCKFVRDRGEVVMKPM